MKKLTALLCLLCFISAGICPAVEDVYSGAQKSGAAEIIKKDAGIIKLPVYKEIDRKAYAEKMKQDDDEYKKIKALAASDYYVFYKTSGDKVKVSRFDEETITDNENDYKNIKDSWVEGYYLFYKTADKILRANNLDTQNMRFIIDKKTNVINASASAANLVTINSALADSFYDNEDALAFVIGHELSHHIFNHMQQNVKAYERINKLDIGIENAVNFSILTLGLTAVFVPIYKGRQHVWFKRLRNNEKEADIEALALMARAGYNTESANDVFAVFAKLPETEKHYTDTHPKHAERTAYVNQEIAKLDLEALRLEGENNLYEKPVMKLRRSSDKKSIVLIPSGKRSTAGYLKETPQKKLINKAYKAYLDDNMKEAAALFEEAYKLDKKNYIPCLYLSYIYEYNYKKTNDKDALKQAKKYAKLAYKKHSADKNTLKQKMDTENL